MTATKNEFDQSSTGHDIELTVMLDGDIARIYFDENFEAIKGMGHGYGSTSRYWFTDMGQADDPGIVADCINWKAATAEDCKAFMLDRYCTGEYAEPESDIADMVAEYYGGDWIEAARDAIGGGSGYCSGIELYDAIGNDFAELGGYFEIKYNVAKIRGYCQGEYAEVLYDPAIWSGDFDPSEYFTHLFYDAPVYARIEVDGEDCYIDELMADNYRWDKSEAEKIVRGFNLPDSVKDWIISELPEYPEYVG